MLARLLIVDDEEAILFAMQDYFSIHGFEVDCARERHSAEAFLASNRYAVVIADLRLGGSRSTDGLEVLGGARAAAAETRTVLLTAYGSPGMEAEAERLGVDAMLNKPRPLPEVARIVTGLLAGVQDTA